jgi:hypothetical protein
LIEKYVQKLKACIRASSTGRFLVGKKIWLRFFPWSSLYDVYDVR